MGIAYTHGVEFVMTHFKGVGANPDGETVEFLLVFFLPENAEALGSNRDKFH